MQGLLLRTLFLTLVVSFIHLVIHSIMAEGTRLSKIDEPIKGFTKFRKETEVQICELDNTISRFMHVVD